MNNQLDNILLVRGIRKNNLYANRSDINDVLVYELLSRFLLPFNEWPAYKVGVIDDKGKILISRSKMNTNQNKCFTKFDLIVLKIKSNQENSINGIISKNMPIQTKLSLLLKESEVPANVTGPAIAQKDIPLSFMRRNKKNDKRQTIKDNTDGRDIKHS